MLELSQSQDSDMDSETLNSSSSSTDRSSTLSRLSFEAPQEKTISKSSPEQNPSLKLHRSAKDFKLIRQIGSGDISKVYLCKENYNSSCLYAMKVVDKRELEKKKKLRRAETEKRILKVLDHPFLPSLYAVFDAEPHFSCVVMEFCSGGDLHSLRHRQPGLRFSVTAARFYAAEVLLALEYLHLLGIVYRDLKPENILIRSDGHIMLSDFDLSLESTSSPSIESVDPTENTTPSCLPNTLFRSKKSHFGRSTTVPTLLHRFVAEPVLARSSSFVGTHEYVSPEVASGGSHGSSVDWWSYGVFLYELMYGRTPFVGASNEVTLRNIVKKPLLFPPVSCPIGQVEYAARDLMSGLLDKNPVSRLGSLRGAADVKAHSFFKGINFALLRTYKPPVVPGLSRVSSCEVDQFEFF